SSAAVGGRFEAGYRFDFGTGAGITPFAAFEPLQIRQNGAKEAFVGYGPGLTYRATDITSLPSYLSVKFDGSVTWSDDTVMAPFVRLAWMHDALPQRNVPRSFAELPFETFNTSTVPTVANAAVIRLGADCRISENIQLTASFDTQLSGSYQR